MDLTKTLAAVKQAFTITKKVDFDEYDLHIEMQPLTTTEELKVLGAVSDFEGAQYIEGLKKYTLAFALKKLNGIDLSSEELEETLSDGSTRNRSKFLILSDQIGEWPASVRDVLFEAFNDMQVELEHKINNSAKFERYQTPEQEEEKEKEKDSVPAYKPVREAEEDSEMTDTERMNRRVEREVDDVQSGMLRTEMDASAKES